MKMKSAILNAAALVCAVMVFGGSFIYAATNITQAKTTPIKPNTAATPSINSAPPNTGDNAADEYLQNDVGIADLIFTPSQTESFTSPPSSVDELDGVMIAAPPKQPPPSSKPKPASSKPKPVSSEPKPAESQPPVVAVASSEPTVSSQAASSEISSAVSDALVQSTQTTPSSLPPMNASNEVLMILSGAVQREIVGTNSPTKPQYYEAYKAQAVACHSYMEYHRAITGAYPPMSYSPPTQQTIDLVSTVVDKLIYYNGSVINAAFHAASGGYTQSSINVWSGNLPYLCAAESRYDDYDSSCTIYKSELASRLAAVGIAVSSYDSMWFDLANATVTDGGFIGNINVCGSAISGRQLRENVIGAAVLKSCKITAIDETTDTVTFTTKGYGHGTGMSQQGALGYAANEGYSYEQILMHYYTGVSIG